MNMHRAQIFLALSLMTTIGVAQAGSGPACTGAARQQPDIAKAQASLQRSPSAVGMRLNLASLLYKTECYDEAVHVLEEGEKYNPHNPFLQYYLNRAHNMQKGLEGLDKYAKLQSLQSQRQASLKRCTEGDGDAALQACMASLVKGAPNEFDITLRIAMLQQSGNQPLQALDSYIAANLLHPGNKEIALAILALLDSTKRKDAVALAARGSSLVTLGRAGEAVAPLRQAYALAPDLPDIGRQLASAEALARAELLVHKQAQARVAAIAATEAVAEVVPEPQSYSNAAPASRSN